MCVCEYEYVLFLYILASINIYRYNKKALILNLYFLILKLTKVGHSKATYIIKWWCQDFYLNVSTSLCEFTIFVQQSGWSFWRNTGLCKRNTYRLFLTELSASFSYFLYRKLIWTLKFENVDDFKRNIMVLISHFIKRKCYRGTPKISESRKILRISFIINSLSKIVYTSFFLNTPKIRSRNLWFSLAVRPGLQT